MVVTSFFVISWQRTNGMLRRFRMFICDGGKPSLMYLFYGGDKANGYKKYTKLY